MLLYHQLNDDHILTAENNQDIHFFKSVVEKLEAQVSMIPLHRYVMPIFFFSTVTIKTGNEKSVILYITCITLVFDTKERIGILKRRGKFRYSLALILRF